MSAVRINMQVGGVAEVRKAFKTVRETVIDLEKTASREAVAAAKRREKAAEKEAQLRIKLAHKEKQERMRLEAATDKEFGKLLLHQTKVAEKAAGDRAKAEERANRKIQHDAEATARHLERIRLNSARAAGRIATREAAEEQRAARKAAHEAENAARKRSGALKSGIASYGGAVGRGVGNVAGMGFRLAGAGMALGGGFAVADAARSYMGAEVASINLANSLYKGGGGKRYSNTKLMDMASEMQGSTGVAKEELLSGWQSYVAKSGDSSPFDGSEKGKTMLSNMAMLAKATGSDTGEVMNAAGMLAMQNKELRDDPTKLTDMMRAIVAQGKEGAVEMSDLARVAGRVTAGATSYAGGQTQNQQRLLGLTQIAMQTSGSPEDAATAVSRFASDVGRHAKDNKGKVNVLDKNNKLVSPAEILEQYFTATKGNTIAMGEGKGNLGLGAESMKIAQAMSATYDSNFATARESGKSEKDSVAAGAAAVRKAVEDMAGKEYSAKDVKDDFDTVRSAKSEKFTAAMARFTEVVEHRGAPMLERLADSAEKIDPEKVKQFADAIASAAEWLVDNPWKGIGLAVTGSIVKEIVAAKAGDAVTKALMALLNRGGAGGGAAAAAGAAGSASGAGGRGTNLGNLAAAGATGYAIGSFATSIGESISGVDDSIGRVEKSKLALNTASQLQDKRLGILAGGSSALSEDEIANYRRQYKAAMEIGQDAQNQSNEGVGILGRVTDAVGLTGHQEQIATQGAAAQSVIDQIRDLDRLTGGQISGSGPGVAKKLEAGDLIDAKGLETSVGGALQRAADKVTFGSPSPADPNAPGRNTPQGARPPA